MKLGEIVVLTGNYNFTKFHQNQMKNKKVLSIARFSDQNLKVLVELWKSYIVHSLWSWVMFIDLVWSKSMRNAQLHKLWWQLTNNNINWGMRFPKFICNNCEKNFSCWWHYHFYDEICQKKFQTSSSQSRPTIQF